MRPPRHSSPALGERLPADQRCPGVVRRLYVKVYDPARGGGRQPWTVPVGWVCVGCGAMQVSSSDLAELELVRRGAGATAVVLRAQ